MKALLEFVARLRPRLPTASLRTYLLIVILLAVAPIALYTSYRISAEANDRHAQMLDTLRRSAASLSENVERELASSVDALNIVSSRITLQNGDLTQFERTLTRRQLRPSWRAVFLTDLNGTVLFDTSEPGARSGYSIAGTLDYTKMAARPAMMVSNIVADRFAGHFTTAIAVPVIIDDVPRYVLGVWIDLPVWQDVIEKAATPARGFAGMVDRDYRVIARTISPESSVGLRATNSSVHAMDGRRAGVERMRVLEGTDSYVGWETVPTSGWTTVVGIAASARDAQMRDLIQAALIVTLGCLALGGGLAVLMARHLTLPLARLSGDTPITGAHIPVREIARLRDALREAHLRDAQARAGLQRKADEFQTLFDSSPIGLAFAQDPECRSVIHNPAMNALVGTAEALKGGQVQVHRLGHPLVPSQLPLQRAAASGESVAPIEFEVIAGDRIRHIVGQAVALREPDGRPRGAIAAVFDVTERRQAELRLTRADRQLVESQRLIDLAQDAGHVGFFHYRYASGLLTWTPGQARLFGVDNATSGDMVLHDWLRLIRRDDRAHAQKTLRRSLAAGEGSQTLEFRVDAPDGSLRWLSSRLVTHYDARQRPLETVGVTVDMTTQKLAERERAKMAERERAARLEAEAANRAKDEFLAMLSHELRNPLGAISSAAEVLKRLDPATAMGAQARDIIARQTRHLAQLVGDLLDVARVTSGKIMLARHRIDLADLAQRLAATLQLTGLSLDHELRLDLEPVWIDADATRIEQIVTNLLRNAVKHTPAGGHILLEVRPEGDEAVLVVRDTGLGISPKLLPHVFDLFVQGERSIDRRAGGLGIGLTLARRLVELHGGTISAANAHDGAVFTVRLPAVPPTAAGCNGGARTPVPQRRIVLVEDNEDALDALQTVLRLDGHSVWAASDGVAGLASILEVRPDVAIVDIGLPGLTGLEVATRSRAAGYAGRMIALSGYGQGADVRKSQVAGFDAHLVKPVDTEGLRRALADT